MSIITIQKTLEPEEFEILDRDLELLWDTFQPGDRQILILKFDDFDTMVDLELDWYNGHPTKDGAHDAGDNPFWALAEALLSCDKIIVVWDRI